MALKAPAPTAADKTSEMVLSMDWLRPAYNWIVITLAVITSIYFFLEQPSLENALLALWMTPVFALIYAFLVWPLAALAALFVGFWEGFKDLRG